MLKILSQYIKEDLLNYFEKLTNKEAKIVNKKVLKRSAQAIIILSDEEFLNSKFYQGFKIIKESGKTKKKFNRAKKEFISHCLVVFHFQFLFFKNIFNTYEYLPKFVTKPKCMNAIDEIGKRKEAKIIKRVKEYMNLVVSNCLDTFISGYLEDPKKKKNQEKADI